MNTVDNRIRMRTKDRVAARLIGLSRPAGRLELHLDRYNFGNSARGAEILSGTFRLGGYVIRAPGRSMWDIASPGPAFDYARHGFLWLDDLVALGSRNARIRAKQWTTQWIAQYGNGRGPGWTADLAARRLERFSDDAVWLIKGAQAVDADGLNLTIARHLRFLSRRTNQSLPVVSYFRVLCLIASASHQLDNVTTASDLLHELERACHDLIDAEGGVTTRSPEDLVTILRHLERASRAILASDGHVGSEHAMAMSRISQAIRTLRHSDGHLPRFHGGDSSVPGMIDGVLQRVGLRAPVRNAAMGFNRLTRGRSVLIIDAALPPIADNPMQAHASTLAFEMTAGRNPLIVSCGPGEPFGQDWARAARGTPSHSTLVVDGHSSSRLDAHKRRADMMVEGPGEVKARSGHDSDAAFIGSHDGYARSYGLTHERSLVLSLAGDTLHGQDRLISPDEPRRRVFERALNRMTGSRRGVPEGIPFVIRFHLHPDSTASLDMNGRAVSVELQNGELWVFRCDPKVMIRLDPSVYLEKTAREPRTTLQIVLSHRASGFDTRVGWSLIKTRDATEDLHDLEPRDPF
ncbi:heparinase II/III family protein [Qingshengfaniella alkalisoli]|uniref:heparinase II/III family protein n=1 Tax=Qingshengfaniella alkalisoli TaxID=2599296 RepID=UPI00143E00A9|nr:heparinase II/III family protein [Qingshengfaniella alkalisoli]